jgi:hypothetical protein
LAFGPAENFASRELSGKGPASFVAGFNPTTATFTLDEGMPATVTVGASSTTGAAAERFKPAAGGTKARSLGELARASAEAS